VCRRPGARPIQLLEGSRLGGRLWIFNGVGFVGEA
jgi:hypothetical protein